MLLGELPFTAVWLAFAEDPASCPVMDFWPLPCACPDPPPPTAPPALAIWFWLLFWVVLALLPAPLAAPLSAPWLALFEPPPLGMLPVGFPLHDEPPCGGPPCGVPQPHGWPPPDG
jgi:hypothetical protein